MSTYRVECQRLGEWYKNKSKSVNAPSVNKSEKYLNFDTDGRKGVLKRPQVYGKLNPDKVKLIEKEFNTAVEKWDAENGADAITAEGSDKPTPNATSESDQPRTNVIAVPSNNTEHRSKRPQWIGFCNSRLSALWKEASKEEIEAVEAVIKDRKDEGGAKKDEKKSWKGEEALSAEEKERLNHAMQIQS